VGVAELAGKTVELDADGHLANANDWDEELAKAFAVELGIPELNDYQEDGDAPSIRRLTKESGVDTKSLYKLFPKGPAKKAAKIAGLPKPKGCI
jgi:tRNA 2-thiouridine synthesizing protein E